MWIDEITLTRDQVLAEAVAWAPEPIPGPAREVSFALYAWSSWGAKPLPGR